MDKRKAEHEREIDWQVPTYEVLFADFKRTINCLVIPVLNEGERIKRLLIRMRELEIPDLIDIFIVDGGSTDGSLDPEFLREIGVRGLLLKTGPGRLSSQLRCAYAHCLRADYQGIVTIDGNDKDDPEAIPAFIQALAEGVDFVQASRFIPGGVAVNTPRLREFAIRWLHAPLLSFASGFRWTDTTQGFRAYSRRMLLDPKIAPFRDVFSGYELLAYLSYRAPKLGFRCLEVPTARRYPFGTVPTKISGIRGNFTVLGVLLRACAGCYNPRSAVLTMKN